ncbi:MAG TPA: alpha-galactosidase [Verrucomicrobiae bacterium]|nr:alpha-galactosidase [Verrucomicrobiae bacterium]
MTARALLLLAAACAVVSPARAQRPWTVRTDDTTVRLTLSNDQLSVASLAPGAGTGNWLTTKNQLSLPDHIFSGNSSRPVQWRFVKANAEPRSGVLTFRFSSGEPKLELLSIWQARSGPGPIEHHVELVNETGRSIEVPLQPSLVLELTAPSGHSLENWWVEKGGGRPSDVGTHREPLHPGYQFQGRSTPYAEAPEMIPWLSIHDRTANAGVYFGIEFSGRVGFDITAAGQPIKVDIVAGLDPSAKDFRSRLGPGERFVSPTVFVGCYKGEVDEGANRLHEFVAEHLRPGVSDRRYPLVVNNSWGSGMAVDEKLARHMIDESAALGVELFHIDAGWFRGVGDWYPDPKKFPRGLVPVRDYAHHKGMLFGLWVGWTQGGTDIRDMESLAVTNPKQRDWFTRDYPPDWKPSDFTGAPVCLGDEPARTWCLDELKRIVSAYKLDLLEHDQIMIVDSCNRTGHSHTESPADVAYRATRGYYYVYDQLRKAHPRLLFENCVNGGRTVDFGIVRRTHYISITDTYDPMSNRRAFYDASYPLPPSMCECYIENKPGPSLGTFKAMLRSGMMGWCTLMCDTGAWSLDQHTAAKRQIDIYKSWIRPLVNHGDLYHVSARPDDTRWDGMQYIDKKTGKGIVFVFRGEKSSEPSHVFQLQGLAREATYQVWSEDGSMARAEITGASLCEPGLNINLREPGASDLIYIKAR